MANEAQSLLNPKAKSHSVGLWLRLDNPNFRTTRWTGQNIQLTLMTIPVGGGVGLEVHETHEKSLRIEQGKGRVQMGTEKDQLTQTKIEVRKPLSQALICRFAYES